MELERFLCEAKALARTGLLLRERGTGEPAAFWHDGEVARVISVSHRGGWCTLSVDPHKGILTEFNERAPLAGRPLYGETYTSLPPVDAVFRCGSTAVAAYLAEHGWSQDDPFNENFEHPTPGAYERIWQENCPMYAPDLFAASGGWHFPWPDGDWVQHLSSELVVWTLAGAEPWFEVFYEREGYVPYERVT